jgi:hypothetical protein
MSDINEGSDIYLSGTGGGGSGIQSIGAGTGITVDSTDPQNPIVESIGLVIVNPGDTAEDLESKLTAQPEGPVKIRRYDKSPGVKALELESNLVEGTNITFTTGPGDSLQINAAGGGGGVVVSIGTGIGISVDETDPAAPIVSSDGLVAIKAGDIPEYLNDKLTAGTNAPVKIVETTPGGGFFRNVLESNLVAGAGITLANGPGGTLEISAGGGPVSSDYGIATFEPALARSGLAIPNVNNGGAVLSTYIVIPASFICRNLSCLIKQTGGGNIILAIYSAAGALLARTAAAAPGATGIFSRPIAFDGAGAALTQITLTGGTGYYLALWGNQAANGAQFYAVDAGTTFGPTPWLGWIRDNVAAIPVSMAPGSESPIRFQILAKT